MQDEKDQPLDDDFLDEDLDVIDDDLGDDDFEGMDDDWDSSDDFVDIDEMDGDEGASGKPSFLKKNFNFIVIGIVGIGGLLFAVGQFGGSAPAPAPVSDEAAVEAADPVPSAEDIVLEETAPLQESTSDVPAADESGEVLTPFPAKDDAEEELASLDFFGGENTDLTPATPVADEASDVDLEDAQSVLAEDLTVEATVEESAPLSDVSDLAEPEPVEMAMEAEPLAVAAPSAEMEAMKDDNARLLEQDLEKTKELEAARAEISGLQDEVKALKAEIETLKAAKAAMEVDVQSAPEPQKTVEKAPAKAEPAVSTQEKKPAQVVEKPLISETPKSSRAVEWRLRSISQGAAVLARVDNGDLRTVEIGDRVPGLGSVRAIEKENGRWVVRGTKSKVSQ